MTTREKNDAGESVGGTDKTTQSAVLRAAMVDELREIGAISSDQVAAAFRKLRREDFAPGAPLEEVYAAQNSVVTKVNKYGEAVSSVSAPELQAVMLEQADIRPGMNVVEYGSGGFNAALVHELVGSEGSVTTVDIDHEVISRARRLLDTAGYAHVKVQQGDAEHGVPEHAPFDRIIVTFGAWDISPALVDQLAEGGRLVVPLRVRGLTRSLALDRHGVSLVSRSAWVCGFVRAQGAGAHEERMLLLRGNDIGLRFDDDGWPADPHQLDGVLGTGRIESWSGVTIGRTESFDTLQFWAATRFPGFCLLATAAQRDAVLVDPGNQHLNLASVDGDSVGYLVTRPAPDGTVELGAHAFGGHAQALADALTAHVAVWDREQRGGPGPTFHVHPAGTPDSVLPDGVVVDKRHSRITISWPPAAAGPGQGSRTTPEKQGE